MNKKLLFVYNPHSGKQAVSRKLSAIVDIFAAEGYDVTCHPTQARLDCMETISEQANLYDKIVVSGGDGTLNEAVNGYMQAGCKNPMGYIPLGSTNDFSHSTGIPIQPLKAAQTVIDGEPMECDLGCFNGRYFTYVAGFGTLTEVSYSTPQDIKNALGFSAYILEGLSALTTIESFNLSYESAERSGEGEYLLGLVTNTLHVAGFKNIVSSNVLLNDGLFEVLLVKKPKNAADLQKIAASEIKRHFRPMLPRFFITVSESPIFSPITVIRTNNAAFIRKSDAFNAREGSPLQLITAPNVMQIKGIYKNINLILSRFRPD